jgi:hypothetical protein
MQHTVPSGNRDCVEGPELLYAYACNIFAADPADADHTRRVIMPVCHQQLRFAIAAFSSGTAAAQAAQELTTAFGLADSVSHLAFRSALDAARSSLQDLPFPNNAQPLACTEGAIAQHLIQKLDGGALTLQTALSTWLIPRHALQLERAVEDGGVLIWVQLYNNEDERNAYRILLSAGCTLVGVHDLVKS